MIPHLKDPRMRRGVVAPSQRSVEERLLLRLTTARGKASKRKLGVRIKIAFLNEVDRWTALEEVRIKRIPDQGTFWQVVEGMKAAAVGLGERMKKR
jgi:hypothetical protein